MIVPYNDPNLASGSGNANSSPFVIAIKNAGIPVLGSVVNVSVTSSSQAAHRWRAKTVCSGKPC
jgi:amino acid transporter